MRNHLRQNFNELQGDFKHFGEEELLNFFKAVFEGLVEKEKPGIVSLSEMELALLYDEVYLSSGDENLLDVDTLQFFSFERATVMASENTKLLDDPRVMIPVVNSDVCSGAHIAPPINQFPLLLFSTIRCNTRRKLTQMSWASLFSFVKP
ncbi:hypothetical protein R1T40_21965 (plasmid) [Tritonibacter scottomollicae]|uniref:Uncharacterized protein n=1 Tax=Tritonibacter scottomollicae TaxID=483013 RepID=A0ABZ0HKQ1_TRISK|nr:hypothetical protein [Tritonibacter scottomollicae]WOI35410.1 hypothetical protein R1T40_21965 [Tritonibacter scottomollicae]